MSAPSLVRALLGDRLDALPAGLRRFHDAPHAGRGVGTLRVERPGGFAGWLGDRLGFPPAGDAVPLELEVHRQGARDRWVRRFGDHVLTSLQEKRGDRLIERVGAVRLSYELDVEGDALVYHLRGARLLGLPLPPFARPVDRTVERGRDDGWEVHVRVALPGLGTMLEYAGRIRWEAE